MNFLQQLQIVSGVSAQTLGLSAVLFLAISFGLGALKPGERMRLRTAILLFLLSLLGLVFAAALLTAGVNPLSSAYKWTRWGGRVFLGIAIVNVSSVFIFEVVLESLRLKPPRIMRDLLIAMSYIAMTITILSKDVDLTGIIATSAVLTAVIGLSFQDTLGNMMAGMALQMERTIGVGDWIKFDGQEGLVREIRWRHTSVETRNWDTLVIPNSALMKSPVIVLGRRARQARQHRQWVYFNVDFRYSPVDVIDAVETALRAEPIPNVAREPEPNCIMMDFKESFGSYAVRYWLTDLAVDDPTNSIVRTRIYFALRRADIPLSIPAHSLFVTDEDQTRSERKRTEEIEERVGALKRVELFKSLTDEERRSLAGKLRVAPFTRGEAITRQGAEAHWLYLIMRGDAEVRISLDGNLSEKVATLHEGGFFGEMGMMTGEPRSATVIALSAVECYRLDKEAFNDVLKHRPEIAEDISEQLARRKVELDAAREGLDDEAMQVRMRSHQGDLLDRIKRFFTL